MYKKTKRSILNRKRANANKIGTRGCVYVVLRWTHAIESAATIENMQGKQP